MWLPEITFSKAYDQNMSHIKPSMQCRGRSALTHVLFGPPKKLAGTKLDCPWYGNHWEVIGFQGKDRHLVP